MATYTQIALQFADLHDRPERMLAKETISRIVSWREARVMFYWRLKRRVLGMQARGGETGGWWFGCSP